MQSSVLPWDNPCHFSKIVIISVSLSWEWWSILCSCRSLGAEKSNSSEVCVPLRFVALCLEIFIWMLSASDENNGVVIVSTFCKANEQQEV